MMSLDRPYSNRDLDSEVVLDIVSGVRPAKPANLLEETMALWPVIQNCWEHETDARPAAVEVQASLTKLVRQN